jgi:hypothetical protein
MNAEEDSLPPDSNELLRRILSAVEPAKPRHGLEIAYAIVFFLSTLVALTTMPICHE